MPLSPAPTRAAARRSRRHLRARQAIATWAALNDSVRGVIGEWNVHGYAYGGPGRAQVYDEVVVRGGKVLRMSEYGEGDGTGASLAGNVMLDFAALHMSSWVYWQTFDPAGGWGMMAADLGLTTATITAVNPKHYVLAQFSRHVRPGMTVLTGGDPTNK